MTQAICDFLSDFGLISYIAMNIEDAEVLKVCVEIISVLKFSSSQTVGRVLAAVDKANGYR